MGTMVYTTPCCCVCGSATELTLDGEKYYRWSRDKELIQNVWPEWSADERELLISGTHASCWDDMFYEEEDDTPFLYRGER